MNKLHWNSLALANSYCRKKRGEENKPHISDMLRKALEYFQCNRTGMILSVCSGGGLKRKKNTFEKEDFWFTLLTWIFVKCNNLSIIIYGNKKSSKLIKIWFNSDKTILTFLCLSFTTTASQNSNHFYII